MKDEVSIRGVNVPVYEFECKNCEKIYEFNDNKELAFCCNQELKRRWSIGGIKFNGAGFYKNDYER